MYAKVSARVKLSFVKRRFAERVTEVMWKLFFFSTKNGNRSEQVQKNKMLDVLFVKEVQRWELLQESYAK